MHKFIIGTVILILLVLLFPVERIPALFRSPARISQELLANHAARCTLSTSIPDHGIVGMSYHTIAGEDRQDEYDALTELGVKHVRIDLGWKYIAHEDGTYDWSGPDALLYELTKRGIEISNATIVHVPDSLRTWEETAIKFEEFMRIIVLRYKPEGEYAKMHPDFSGIRYWEIFNEPNLPGVGFLPPNVEPREFVDGYAIVLMSANRAIHDVDPKAFVITAGLSISGMPPQEFFTRIISLAPNCFDIAAYHPYGLPGQFQKTAEKYRSIMSAQGIIGRPLWFNEYGTTEDAGRAKLISAAFTERSAADAFFWFTLRDLALFGENYGVLEYNYARKPEYWLLRDAFTKSTGI